MAIMEDMTSEELGFGANLLLWGFRASATGRSRCWLIEQGFRKAMGDRGQETLAQLRLLAAEIGLTGHRKITLIPTPCKLVTEDELGLVAAMSAATTDDRITCKHYLSWLMAKDDIGDALDACHLIGKAFSLSAIPVKMPAITLITYHHGLCQPNTGLTGTA